MSSNGIESDNIFPFICILFICEKIEKISPPSNYLVSVPLSITKNNTLTFFVLQNLSYRVRCKTILLICSTSCKPVEFGHDSDVHVRLKYFV